MSSNEKEQKIQEIISGKSDEAEQIDAIAAIRGWFRPKDDSVFYPHVRAYMDGTADLTKAMEQITKPIDEGCNTEGDIDFPDLSYSIMHAAKRTPYSDVEAQAKLVKLLYTVRNHAREIEDYFMGAAREVMNDVPGVGAGYTVPEAHAHANLNYFFASVTKEDVFGLELYCIWEMRAALENKLTDDGQYDAHIPGTATEKYNARVPAAAVWVQVLGKKLYEREEDLKPKGAGQGNPAKGGELWKGVAGFDKGRWALWKKRFGEISELGDISEETKKIAKEAVKVMEESEGS
jgi:hypothetical protein